MWFKYNKKFLISQTMDINKVSQYCVKLLYIRFDVAKISSGTWVYWTDLASRWRPVTSMSPLRAMNVSRPQQRKIPEEKWGKPMRQDSTTTALTQWTPHTFFGERDRYSFLLGYWPIWRAMICSWCALKVHPDQLFKVYVFKNENKAHKSLNRS